MKDVPWYLVDHPVMLERKQELVRHAEDIQDALYQGLYRDRVRRIEDEEEEENAGRRMLSTAQRAHIEDEWRRKDKWSRDWTLEIYYNRLYGLTTKEALREAARFDRLLAEKDDDLRAFFRYV
jgi:O-methyltransferase involved in polyketide biosynthesis